MTCEDQSPDTHDHRERREENRGLVRVKQLLSCLVPVQQAFHDEYAEIVAHTEDECGENDVHDIELDSQEAHYSSDYDPAYSHRKEAEQCQLQPAVRNP